MFFSQLLLLFQFCPICKTDNPDVATRRIGTSVEVKTVCQNENCLQRENTWRSQPDFTGTLIPAGNLLLSFGILLGGGSAGKVFHIFDHMGLARISLATFFSHQKVSLYGFRSTCYANRFFICIQTGGGKEKFMSSFCGRHLLGTEGMPQKLNYNILWPSY